MRVNSLANYGRGSGDGEGTDNSNYWKANSNIKGLKEQIEMSLGKGFQLLKHPLPESLQHLQC